MIEDSKNNGLNFFSFSMDDKNLPVFAENTRKDWVQYGDDNQYGEYLISLMNNSSKHNSLIKKKVNMAVGNGFKNEEFDFIRNSNGKEDLNTIVYKNGYDLMVYGMYALAITWSRNKSKIARISYVDVSKVRIAKELNDDSDMAKRQADGVDFYYISSDWDSIRKEKHKPKLIQGFSEKYNDVTTQLMVVKEYRPGTDFYTLPDYISSIDWIELDKEIANFHLSSVHNGFTPSMIISFKGGIPTEEEMDDLYKKIQSKYGGSSNGSKVFITYSENGDTAPEFIPVNLNSSDQRFLQLEEQIQQNIIIAHGASPVVAGVATSGKLGSSSEIIEAETMFQTNVINAKQKLLERTYNQLARINGIEEELLLEGVKSFNKDNVIPQKNEVTMESIVKKITEENKSN